MKEVEKLTKGMENDVKYFQKRRDEWKLEDVDIPDRVCEDRFEHVI